MSKNFTPLNYSSNSSSKNNNTNYISNTNNSPNQDKFSSNNINHFSAMPDISGMKEVNFNNNNNINLNTSNCNSNTNEFNNSFRNTKMNKTDIFNVTNNNNIDNESSLIQQLRKDYDERIISLYNNIKMVISKIENDDILASMRDDMDNNNSPFINDRIKEILDENFYTEKEKIIEKLTFENANLKNNLNNLLNNKNVNGQTLSLAQQLQIKKLEKIINELNINVDSYTNEINNKNMELHNLQQKYNIINNELMKLKQENSSFYDSFGNYDQDFIQCKKNLCDANKEIDRLNKVINVIEIDLNSAEEAQREKNNKIEQLTKEMTKLQNELLSTNLKYKKLMEDSSTKQNIIEHYESERNDLINKCNSYNSDTIKNNSDKNSEQKDDIEKKYKEKYNEMKVEITNLQKLLNEYEEKEKKYKKSFEEMENNLRLVSSEWEKKFSSTQSDYENIIKNLENKMYTPPVKP